MGKDLTLHGRTKSIHETQGGRRNFPTPGQLSQSSLKTKFKKKKKKRSQELLLHLPSAYQFALDITRLG